MGGKGSGRKAPKTSIKLKNLRKTVGQKGGQATASRLPPERRREIAIKASEAAAEVRTRKAKERQGK